MPLQEAIVVPSPKGMLVTGLSAFDLKEKKIDEYTEAQKS